MAKNGKRSGKRTPTPARAGDTLDNLPSFSLSRELYEAERKEVYTGILLRLSELKSIRKKTADVLGITADQEREVSRVIHLYEGDDGILALFQNADEEAEFTAEEVKKGGKDRRQRELPIDSVPSGSTEETRGSTEPVGVASIDQLVDVAKPLAPSDLDWDGFRREVVNMAGDERLAIREYAERWHQYNSGLATDGVLTPKIPGFLHALFTDLSPAYAKALGGREDVLYETDMARAMAKAKRKQQESGVSDFIPTAPVDPAYKPPTAKQLAALEAIHAGHMATVSVSMYRKLAALGLVDVTFTDGRASTAGLTAAGKEALPEIVKLQTGVGMVSEYDRAQTPEEREKTHALIASEWDGEALRVAAEEPVAPLTAIANEESKAGT